MPMKLTHDVPSMKSSWFNYTHTQGAMLYLKCILTEDGYQP